MVNYIIFDMDGVIFDTERFYLECLRPAAETVGLENIEEIALACTGLTEEETQKKLIDFYGPDAPLEQLNAETMKHFRTKYEAEGFPEKPGVREILSWLREMKIPTAIASSTRTDIVRKELSDAGLLDCFDVVIGGDLAEKSKPAPDVFLKAAEALKSAGAQESAGASTAVEDLDSAGASPAGAQDPDLSEFYVIEDSFNGIRAASAAGMKPLMVPDLLQPDDEIRALAWKVFPSLKEVLAYLKTE